MAHAKMKAEKGGSGTKGRDGGGKKNQAKGIEKEKSTTPVATTATKKTLTQTAKKTATTGVYSTPDCKAKVTKPKLTGEVKRASAVKGGPTSGLQRPTGNLDRGVVAAASSGSGADAPVVEDLERFESSMSMPPLPSPSGISRAIGDTGKTPFKGGTRCPLKEEKAEKNGSVSNRKPAVASLWGNSVGGNDDDDDDEDDDDEDDDEEEEEEDDEEDDDDDEDDDDEDDDDDDEDDDEEEEDDDDDEDETFTTSTTKVKRVDEQITVKVSREGDRNVKVIVITRKTRFAAFVKNIMRRFAYRRARDFDMYCVDAAGDHVDIDVPNDFKSLIRQHLQGMRRDQCSSKAGGAAAEISAQGSTSRFSARGVRLASASLSHTNPSANTIGTVPDEGDRSSSTVLRLYVRDSYSVRHREDAGQRRVVSSLVTSTSRSPKENKKPALGPTSEKSLTASELATTHNDAFSSSFGDTTPKLSHTIGSLGVTINFREDTEVQWSKIGLLGKGSFGSVYEGITSEGKITAVKVLEIPRDENAEEVKVIQREINLMRSLKHKNIVAYYGCQTKDLPNGARHLEIFLEHCHGGSLTQLRRKFERANERFSISLVRAYTKQILEGLNYLHKMNVIHRDLKGDNVLISSFGEAKLADFGCSKRMGTATLQQENCGERGAGYQTMVGTPLFMAPEVLNCEGGYAKPADVWSVGCLLLELLGRQPWTCKSNANAFQIMYIISKSTDMPTGVPKKCPANLLDFFSQCFLREPSKRATAAELLGHDWITCPDGKLQEVPVDED